MNKLADATLHEWFPRRVCVNLKRRPDRWAAVREQFRRHGFEPVTRFEAFDGRHMEIPNHWKGRAGVFGCLMSHLEIVRKARDRGYGNVLIFEDDVVFDADLGSRLPAIMDEMPADWDMFSFGGIHINDPIRVTQNIYRMTQTYSTHAIVLNHSIFEAFIHINQQSTKEPVDENNTHLQQTFNCYCALPPLAWQKDNWSDVQPEQESNWIIRESLVLYGSEVAHLLSQTTAVIAYKQQGDGVRSRRNLDHVLNFYHEHLPQIQVLVVAEQGQLQASQLPSHCRYIAVAQADSAQRALLFRRGFESTGHGTLFIFSDANIWPAPARYVRANLLMCQRRGGTNFFNTLIQLDEADTELVCRGRHGENFGHYEPRPTFAPEEGAFMLTREVLEEMGPRPITDLASLPLFSTPYHGVSLSC